MKVSINKFFAVFAVFVFAGSFVLAAPKKAAKKAQTQQNTQAAQPPKQPAAQAAAAEQQNAALQCFASWDSKLESLKTDFKQIMLFGDTEISASAGRLYKLGNHIKIDTLEKGKVVQSAVTDKKIIKVYDDKGKLITEISWAQWQAAQPNKALFDFGNYANVLKTHKVKEFSKTQEQYKIAFEPLSTAQGETYTLEFVLAQKDCFPVEISLSNGETKTKTTLEDTKKNVKLEESLFK